MRNVAMHEGAVIIYGDTAKVLLHPQLFKAQVES